MLTIEDLKGRRLGIIGFGKEGQATARFLKVNGLAATIFDEQPVERFTADTVQEYSELGFTFACGQTITDFPNTDILFRSPGFRRLHPALLFAEQAGVVITSQTKWFLEHCPAPVIGVTGTKGKGTTVSLIARCLEQSVEQGLAQGLVHTDSRVFITGNIGKEDPFELLQRVGPHDIVVFELSSFQLQDVTQSPHIGVCLMVTQEHLDHHATVEEYINAKSNILAFQTDADIAVYAGDYKASRSIAEKSQGIHFSYSAQAVPEQGAYIHGETIEFYGVETDGMLELSQRILRGAHNMENMAAASLAVLAAGVPLSVIEQVLISFPGLEHRLEFVGSAHGVSYYNDSFSTVPESTIAAVKAFREMEVVILGGSEKNSDFTELADTVAQAQNIRGLILIGVTASRIAESLDRAGYSGPTFTGAQNMEDIFKHIQQIAQEGDVVLLSPACASFGMFANYKDRGQQFKQQVAALVSAQKV